MDLENYLLITKTECVYCVVLTGFKYNLGSNKMHTFITKSTRYHNLYFMSYILPLHVSTRVGHLQVAQCQCLAKVIINYNLLKLC
jgi:hypothetical protein